jgi:hypothetical protein
VFGLGQHTNGTNTRDGTTQYGVIGQAQGDATATLVGGYFGIYSGSLYPIKAALNAVTTGTDPIFVGRTDNVTKATLGSDGALSIAGSFTPTGVILAADGSEASPGVAFAGASSVGFVRQGAGIFDAAALGHSVVRFTGNASGNRYLNFTAAAGGAALTGGGQ